MRTFNCKGHSNIIVTKSLFCKHRGKYNKRTGFRARLRYGKEENDLNKKHEVWKSAKLSQICSMKQTYLDVYLK